MLLPAMLKNRAPKMKVRAVALRCLAGGDPLRPAGTGVQLQAMPRLGALLVWLSWELVGEQHRSARAQLLPPEIAQAHISLQPVASAAQMGSFLHFFILVLGRHRHKLC